MSLSRQVDERLQQLSDRLEAFVAFLRERPVVSVLTDIAFSMAIAAALPGRAGGPRWRWRVRSGRHAIRRVLSVVALQAVALWLKHRAEESHKRSIDEFVRRHGRQPTEEEARRLWSGAAA